MLEQIFGKPDFHGVRKLSDRVFVYFSYVNSTIVLADDGVCIIDSQVNSGQVKRMMAEIRKITNLPIKWVINTHYHWDHVIGNRFFKDQGATIYAHELTKHFMKTRMKRQWAFLKGRGFSMEEPIPTLPDQTYRGETNLNLPGIDLQLKHLGATETDDMTAIYLPRENFLCTGDTLLTGSFPIFGMAVMNEGLNEARTWLTAIQSIRAFQADHLIPGHGPLGSEKDLDLMENIQTFFLDEVERYVNEGLSLEQMVVKIHEDMPDTIRKMPEVWGTRNYAIYRLYHSFTGWMDYKPSAIPWATDDELAQALARAENDAQLIEKHVDEAMEKREFGIALSLARHLGEIDDQNANYRALLAECLMESARTTSSILEKGDFFALAKAELDEALEIDNSNARAMAAKGMFMVIRAEKNGTNPIAGIQLLESAINSNHLNDRRRAKALLGLALGYLQTGRREEAMERAREILQIEPQMMPAQRLLQALESAPN